MLESLDEELEDSLRQLEEDPSLDPSGMVMALTVSVKGLIQIVQVLVDHVSVPEDVSL